MTFFPVLLASLCAAANPGTVPLNSLQLNGWAVLSDGHVRLTYNSSQASSAFVPTAFPLGPNDNFAAFFVYQSQQELGQCVADGIAFVSQNTLAGPGYLGSDGSGLRFITGTVSPAIGVTFDYYANQITRTPANAAAIATPADSGVPVARRRQSPVKCSVGRATAFSMMPSDPDLDSAG